MTYKVTGEITLQISWNDDAETTLDVTHQDLDIYIDASDEFEPLALGSTSLTEKFEIEVDAETPEEAETKAIEMLGRTDMWQLDSSIGCVRNLVSTFVDDVTVNIYNVEPVTGDS